MPDGLELKDPQDIRHRAEFEEAINGGKETATKRSLRIVFENMQYNFDKIQGSLSTNEQDHQKISGSVTDLQFQVNALDMKNSHQDFNGLKKKVDMHIIEDKHSLRKFFVGVVGIGGVGAFIIVLQLISIVLG